jgi:hypothetical protein
LEQTPFKQPRALAVIYASSLMSIVTIGLIVATPIPRAKFGIPSAEFKLLSADGSTLIGRARFAMVQRTPEQELLQVKYQFINGEYDIDEDSVQLQPNNNGTAV